MFNPKNRRMVEQELRNECQFHLSDWIIINQHLSEQQVFKRPPAPPEKSEAERHCERLALQSQSAMKSGNCKQAIAVLEEAYRLIKAHPTVSLETRGFVVGNLGVAFQSIGEHGKALKYHLEHLDMFPVNVDPAAHARSPTVGAGDRRHMPPWPLQTWPCNRCT